MAFIKKFDGNADKAVTLGKPGEPTQVEGYFLGSKDTPDKGYGPGKLHIFQTEEGNIGVWGKTSLNRQLGKEDVGKMTRVTFTGMKAPAKKGKNASYSYLVETDPANTTDVSGVDLNSSSEGTDYDDGDSDDSNDTSSYTSSRPVTTNNRPAASAPDAARRAQVESLLKGGRK